MFLYQIILITTTTSIKTKGTENLTEISKSIDTYQYLILRYPSDNKQLLLSFHTQKRKKLEKRVCFNLYALIIVQDDRKSVRNSGRNLEAGTYWLTMFCLTSYITPGSLSSVVTIFCGIDPIDINHESRKCLTDFHQNGFLII